MTTHSTERATDGMVPQWVHHPSADTPAESDLGEQPYFGNYAADLLGDEFAHLGYAEAARNSIAEMDRVEQTRMDAAEAAADALSKWAHLLPAYATEARAAAQTWRLARGL